MFRTRLDEIQAQTDSEKDWWEKRRASIQSEFMKEIESPVKTNKVVSDDDAVLVENASNTGSIRKKKGKK
jgi:translocation protein SEC66